MHKYKLLIVLFLIIGIIISVIAFFLFTQKGVEVAVKAVLSQQTDSEEIAYIVSEGNLAEGITFENIELKKLKNFPEGTVTKIQKLFVNLTSFGVEGLVVRIENARLRLPDSEPVILTGVFENNVLDFNVYSNGLTIGPMLKYFSMNKKLQFRADGLISDIDLYIKGSRKSPSITGGFLADRVVYKGVVLSNAPGYIDVLIKDLGGNISFDGYLKVDSGSVQSRHTLVKLEESKIFFSGSSNDIGLNIKGNANIDRVKINIVLKGTLEKPDLQLSSKPSLSQERLMVMLATGQSWKGVEKSVSSGTVSPALAKDFIDYFLFAGKSNQFAQKFGLSELTVNYNKESKGVSARKAVTNKLDLEYGVEQSMGTAEKKGLTQTVGGEYMVTDTMAVGVEREIKNKDAGAVGSGPETQNNDKVLLKYQKNF